MMWRLWWNTWRNTYRWLLANRCLRQGRTYCRGGRLTYFYLLGWSTNHLYRLYYYSISTALTVTAHIVINNFNLFDYLNLGNNRSRWTLVHLMMYWWNHWWSISIFGWFFNWCIVWSIQDSSPLNWSNAMVSPLLLRIKASYGVIPPDKDGFAPKSLKSLAIAPQMALLMGKAPCWSSHK